MLSKIRGTLIFALSVMVMQVALVNVVSQSTHAQELPPLAKVALSVSVRVDNMSQADLFAFVSNVDNDVYYWPGVLTSETIQPGPNGGLQGSVHRQTGDFNGFPFETIINIDKVQSPWYMIHHGSGLLSYKTIYTVFPIGHHSAIFTTTSTVEGYGVTAEQVSQFNVYAFNSLLGYLGKSGSVWVNFATNLPVQ